MKRSAVSQCVTAGLPSSVSVVARTFRLTGSLTRRLRSVPEGRGITPEATAR